MNDIELMQAMLNENELCSRLRLLDVQEHHIERLKRKGIDALAKAYIMISELAEYWNKEIESEVFGK